MKKAIERGVDLTKCIGIVSLLLLTGCQVSDPCVGEYSFPNSIRANINVLDYREGHTVQDCFEHCKKVNFTHAIGAEACWSDEYCLEVCK